MPFLNHNPATPGLEMPAYTLLLRWTLRNWNHILAGSTNWNDIIAATPGRRVRGTFSARGKEILTKQQTKQPTAQPAGIDKRFYTLDVFLMSGPLTKSFVKKNKVVSRTIQIRRTQTLADLHHAIFHAFDREEEHLYEFQVGGKGPMDPKARRYTLHASNEDVESEIKSAGDVHKTTLGALGLKVADAFGYWFDFGDDWWHQINVVAITEATGRGKFPKVVKRVGESPPQYVDWDETVA